MAIIDTLIGGVLATAGGAGAMALQAHYQNKARVEEHAERRREARRGQAERVFEELHGLLFAYHKQQTLLFRQVIGAAASTDELEPATSSSLLGIVSIYFPECLPIVEEFDKAAQAIITKGVAAISQIYAAHPEDAKSIQRAHFLMAQKLGQLSSEFSKRLRAAMQTEIEKLW